MDTGAIALDGYLAEETVPGDIDFSTARFRIEISPTDERTDRMVLPCSVSDPELARFAVSHLQPGDLLRVTGFMRIPRTPDAPIWFEVLTLELLAPVPVQAPADQGDAFTAEPTIGADVLIERYGRYLLVHDPVGVTVLWSESGSWVGETEDPGTLADLIAAFERRS
jgi:hypothetical protein